LSLSGYYNGFQRSQDVVFPDSLPTSACLIETGGTPENTEGDPDAPELAGEGYIQMDTPVIRRAAHM
jgi:hypothetical protein